MEVTEVTITMAETHPDHNLLAFANVTFDNAFVVRDMKIIRRRDGKLLLAMPSRKLSFNCATCRCKNPVDANYCNRCGKSLPKKEYGRKHEDVAHPIDASARRMIEQEVLEVYQEILEENSARRSSRE